MSGLMGYYYDAEMKYVPEGANPRPWVWKPSMFTSLIKARKTVLDQSVVNLFLAESIISHNFIFGRQICNKYSFFNTLMELITTK